MTVGQIWYYVVEQMLKDFSGGYVRPEVFNRILEAVNLEFFNTEYDKYERTQEITDNLRPLVVTLGDGDNQEVPVVNGYIDFEEDYFHLSSLRLLQIVQTDGDCGDKVQRIWHDCEILTDDQFNVRRGSRLLAPTYKEPVATVQNNKIRVLPEGFSLASITYLKKPVTPVLDYIVLDQFSSPRVEFLPAGEVHDGSVLTAGTPSRTVELEWPEQVHTRFAEACLNRAMRRLSDPRMQTTKEQ
jgi:hypothetical protein